MRRGWLAAVFAGVLLLSGACAQAQPLKGRLQTTVANARLGKSTVGVMLMDTATEQVLAEHNPDRAFIPASNMKLISSGVAIDVLRPDYVFETQIIWQPEARRLIVRGAGDPSLGDQKLLDEAGSSVGAYLAGWVEAVKRAGIERIDELVIDDRVFDRQFVHPTWPDAQLNRWYCAEVSGFMFHTNLVNIYTTPTSAGRPPSLKTEPRAPWLSIRNEGKTVTSGQQTAWVARPVDTNDLTLRGNVRWATDPVEVTLTNYPEFFARLFADNLAAGGLRPEAFRVARDGEDLSGGTVVHRERTPLKDVLRRCNADSYNLYAEAMLKLAGHEVTGGPGSWKTGAAVCRMVLLDRLGSEAGQAVTVADGSGMSRENRVTPRVLARWITSLHTDKELGDAFRTSLAQPGKDGTLDSRFRHNRPSNHIYAKSGYLNGVSTLSGLVVNDSTGRAVAFSVLINDKPNDVALATLHDFQEKVVLLADRYVGQGN